jgi:hypothetical protein
VGWVVGWKKCTDSEASLSHSFPRTPFLDNFRVADHMSGDPGPGLPKILTRVGNHSPKMCKALRANVSVQVKNVRGIVLSFERDEPLIVPAIRGSHGLLAVAT